MPPPDVEEIPDGEDYPAGGLMIHYKDSKGIIYKDLFFPNDLEAYSRNMLSITRNSLTELHRAEAANFLRYESFDESTTDCIIAFKPPNPHDHFLYRTFEFSSSLWIRVWDSHIPIAPNEQLEFFCIDIVDVSGHPQVKQVLIIYSMMDDILSSIASPTTCLTSQLQSGKHAGHEWSPVLCMTFRIHICKIDAESLDYYLEEHPVRGKVVTVTKGKD
ncbi:hypothetical protein EDD18DRAFT_1106323 [Armillaria luteobubalina]|uniref:Uncharacterized protein n=1 Tax=Armillaria luteobubalina TaxID=153913 RepID=A0AA39USN8_9AGAR|nr:hypothetical protein EDD18DRAFT_1106323 [Armillaria luteobubalina]